MFLKNTAGQPVTAHLISKTDGSDVVGGTTTVYRTDVGGSPSQVVVGTATSEGNGVWSFIPAQEDTNRDHFALTFVNPSAVSVTISVYPTRLSDILLEGIKADLVGVTGEARRSLLNALRKLMNRWYISGDQLHVTKEDDATDAYTETLTGTQNADSVTGSDPN